VSCPADSWLKTRRESAPCCVTSPRRACRSAEEPSGDLTAETRVGPVDTLLAGCTVASPQAGRLSRRSRGPNFIWGCDLRSDAQGIARRPRSPPRSDPRTENVRGPSSALRRSLLHVPPAPGHCRGLAPCLTPISRVFRSIIDCHQINMRSALQGSQVVPRISGTGH